jgi:raffinose/stachyose/melibiose transport system substrate-binding protein
MNLSLKLRNAGVLAAAALLATGGLAACGDDNNATTPSGDAGAGPVTVTLCAWHTEDNVKPWLDKAQELVAADNITIEYISVPHGQEYDTWLNAQIAAGEAADLMMPSDSNAMAKSGKLADVSDRPVVSEFNESGLLTDADGKVFGYGLYAWYSAYFYNVDLFEQYKVDIPKTWDDYLAASKVFLDAGVKPHAFGLAAGGDTAFHSFTQYLENYYWHNGAGSPETNLEWGRGDLTVLGNWDASVNDWRRIIDEGILTTEALGMDAEQARAEFKDGKAAMMISGPWDYDTFTEAGLNFGVMNTPSANPDDPWLYGGEAGNVTINKDTKNMDAALKVFDAIGSAEVQLAVLEANPGSSSFRIGVEQPLPSEYDMIAPTLAKGNVYMMMNDWGKGMEAGPMVTKIQSEIEVMIGENISTEEFLANLDSYAEEVRY